MDTCKKGVLIMYTSTTERFMDKNVMPTSMEIDNLLWKEAYQRLSKLETFLHDSYDLVRELKFPFGNNYGLGLDTLQSGK
jgi:hypothetical protein